MNRIAFPLLLFVAVAASAQTSVKTRPTPDWTTTIDYPQSPSDTVGAGGYFYLLSEWQEHAEKQEAYYRLAIKVLTAKGLSTASSIQVNFDPSFQQLYFHKLVIRRGGQSINILPGAKFEVLRREQNMDRQIYDKSLDAMLNVEDVQVGDIIEYSYSIVGHNPVFANKMIHKVRQNFAVPIAMNVDRLVFRTSRKLNLKKFNHATDPVRETIGQFDSYTWISENVPALNFEDNVPEWYHAQDAVEISEFDTWGDVNNWALPLYTQQPIDKKAIDVKVEEIKSAHLTLENRIAATIRFVQDEIRYLSFSDGIQGYRPHDPSVVLKQRFGDCKDKSLLLTTMLRQLGVEANPALVHSSAGKTLDESLPTPYAFDHCIAQFVFNDTIYWTDPTASLERGSFKDSQNADYHKALVIKLGTTDLVNIDISEIPASVKLYETYSFNLVGGSAELRVKTIYSGPQANTIRGYYKSRDKDEIKQSYTNFYANEYPEITMIDYVSYEDNEVDNIIESTEFYEIENFWTRDSVSGVQTADFYARIIAQYFEQPSTKARKMPFALSHPVSVIQNITIEVPDDWRIEKASSKISSPGFRFTNEVDYVNKKIFLRYTYESRKDHIAASESVRHVKDCDRAINDLSFQLTQSPPSSIASSSFNIPFSLIGIFVLPLIVIGLVWLYKYDPRSRDYEISYEGFGGWLVLPVIGIFLTPVWSLINISRNEFFNYLHWEILTNPSHSAYNPKLGTLVLIEYVYELAFLAYSLFVAVLMVRRRTSFPLFASILYGVSVAFICFDSICLHSLGMATTFDTDSGSAAVRSIIAAVIWIPYINFSERVKGTFTERIE